MQNQNYNELVVTDYLNIDKIYNVRNLQVYYLQGRIKKLTPKYNIKDRSLTHLTKYLFYIQLENYYDENCKKAFELLQNMDIRNTSYENPNVYIDDVNNTSYDYKEVIKDPNKSFVFHVLIDVNAPQFGNAIELLRKSSFYLNDYVYKSLSTNKIVVQLYCPSRQRVLYYLRGEYDKLFKERNYENLTNSFDILTSYFNVDLLNEDYKFTKESAVLLGLVKESINPGEAEKIIKEFNIDDEKTIKFLYEKHGYCEAEVLT